MASRTASILVTDLVGSTELRARLGEDRAEDIRRSHDRALADAIESHGGTVVKGLGDGLLAMFDGAADALAAAVELQQAIDAHNRRHRDAPLEVRVGLAAGDVTVEDGDCFGTPVIQASRLCAAAGGAQILASDLVRALAGSRGDHDYRPVGALDLKGLPEPVMALAVGWEPEAGVGIPLPPELAVSDRARPFAGRAAERQRLKEAWSRVVDGERRIVLVAGEPGIGKTRLSSELAATVHAEGCVVLFGGCDDDLQAPYRPFAEAFAHLVEHVPAEVLDAHIAACGGDLTPLVPGLKARTGVPEAALTGDPEVDRLHLFDAAGDLLARTCQWAPVLMVLDDLHWADESSVRLLRHLVRAQPVRAVLLLGTYRDTDVDRRHPLAGVLADLRRSGEIDRITLGGWDTADIADFMTRAARHELSPELLSNIDALAELLAAETEGNPFFVGEVITHLVETGLLYREDGQWTAERSLLDEAGVPEGIRDVIGRRLSALPPQLNELLHVAAVAGQEFDAGVLAEVADRDIDGVVVDLETAAARGLLVEGGRLDRWRFAHALVRQTLTEELSTSRRVRLHHRIATALEDSGTSDVTELAHHFCEAALLADAERAVDYARRASGEAVVRLAWEQAVDWLRKALEADEVCEPDDTRRAELHLELGTALNQMGDPAAGRTEFLAAADLARRLHDAQLLARAAIGYGGEAALWVEPGEEVGPRLADEAEAALPPGDSALRALLLAKRSMWGTLRADRETRLRLAEAAVAMAERLADAAALPVCLASRLEVLRGEPAPQEQLQLGDAMEAAATRAGNELAAITASYVRCFAHATTGDFDAMEAAGWEMAGRATRARLLASAWASFGPRIPVALHRARFDDAERMAEEQAKVGRAIGGPTADMVHRWFSAWQAGLKGDAHAEVVALQQLSSDYAYLKLGGYDIVLAGRRAQLEGDGDAARRLFDQWDEVPDRHDASARGFRYGMLALAVADLGDARRAGDLLGWLAQWSGLWIAMSVESPYMAGDHLIGLLQRTVGDLDGAITALEAASAAYNRSDAHVLATHLHLDLAQTLRARGIGDDEARARSLVTDAVARAQALGLPGVRARALELG